MPLRLLFAVEAIFAAVFAFFFFSGVSSDALSSTALVVWFLIFCVLCSDLLGALFFYVRGLAVPAQTLLVGYTFPAVIALLLMTGTISF